MKTAPIFSSCKPVLVFLSLLLFNNHVHAALFKSAPLGCNYIIGVMIDLPSVGGVVASSQTICPGVQPASLSLSGNTGNVIKWQKSINSDFSSPIDINETSLVLDSNTIGILNETTYYRAVVQNGTSAPANSGYASITMKTVAPELGAVSGFLLFTVNGAVSNTGLSVIHGDIGTNVGDITGFEAPSVVSGNLHNADSVTEQASLDLIALYNALVDAIPTNSSHPATFGGGETLTDGFYAIGGAASVAGNLTLDAQGDPGKVFIFRSAGAFTMGAGTTIILSNGALASNVFWVSGGAIAMAASTSMAGTMIADGAVSMGAGGMVNGRMYSVAGAVSVYDTSTVELVGVGGITSGSATVCPLSNQAVLTLTQNAGNVIKWQSSTNSDFESGVLDIANTTTTLVHPNITGTTWFRAVVESNLCGAAQYSTISKLTVIVTTWDGTAWDNGIPDAVKKTIFSDNAAIASNMEACSCHLSGTAQVTVESGHSFTVTDAITVESGARLIIQNNANLIQVNDVQNSGDITVNRDSAPIVRLDHTLWSSPVTGSGTLLQFSPQTLPNRFYKYNTTTNGYLATAAGGTFPLATAVAIRAPNNWPTTQASYPGSYTGVPNNGNIAFALDAGGAGYNGVGNPYPSAISGSAFVAANSAQITGTLYFYAHTLSMNSQGSFPEGTNYAMWNPGTGGTPATAGGGGTGSDGVIPNGILQVGQGFLVKASAPGNLIFNNTMREHDTGNQFFRNNNPDTQIDAEIERHRVWLSLAGNTGALNTILIGYATGATAEIDYGYDGLKFGGTGSELYSLILGNSYSIQGRTLPFDANDVVALGFKADSNGMFSIGIYDTDGLFAQGQDIFLRDNLTGTVHDIKTSPYSFSSELGTFDSRFELVYIDATLGVENKNLEQATLAYNDGTLSVKSRFTMDKIQIFDLRGRLIFEENGIGSLVFHTNDIYVSGQVLLVRITGQDKQITKKIVF